AVDLAVSPADHWIAARVVATSNGQRDVRFEQEVRIVLREFALAIIDCALPSPAGPQLPLEASGYPIRICGIADALWPIPISERDACGCSRQRIVRRVGRHSQARGGGERLASGVPSRRIRLVARYHHVAERLDVAVEEAF